MPGNCAIVRTVDVHIGGDVHQIIMSGVKSLPGDTVGEQMQYLESEADGLRQLLLHEPRGGHPSHFADLVVRSGRPEAEAGFVIMEYMGYPLFSGSNTMATAIALLEDGHLPMADGRRELVLESPGGLVTLIANCQDGKVVDITYQPDSTAYVAQKGARIDVPGWGSIEFDVVWSGCFYSVIDGPSYGLDMVKEEEAKMGAFAEAFMEAAREQVSYEHFELGDQGPAVFVLFTAPPIKSEDGILERRISPVVYPHSVSRCPSGTGTTAAVAQLVEYGDMQQGDPLRTRSCWDVVFEGECYHVGPHGSGLGCRVEVKGRGWVIARKELIVDFDDPLTPSQGLGSVLL